jgi:hypothetical protein
VSFWRYPVDIAATSNTYVRTHAAICTQRYSTEYIRTYFQVYFGLVPSSPELPHFSINYPASDWPLWSRPLPRLFSYPQINSSHIHISKQKDGAEEEGWCFIASRYSQTTTSFCWHFHHEILSCLSKSAPAASKDPTLQPEDHVCLHVTRLSLSPCSLTTFQLSYLLILAQFPK